MQFLSLHRNANIPVAMAAVGAVCLSVCQSLSSVARLQLVQAPTGENNPSGAEDVKDGGTRNHRCVEHEHKTQKARKSGSVYQDEAFRISGTSY